MKASGSVSRMSPIGGKATEIVERGDGTPMLFLHSEAGISPDAPVLELLGRHARVIAPSHPGFGRSELGSEISTVSDLAFHYLDLIRELDLQNLTVVGVGLGGWIAAEIAVMDTHDIDRLVIANSFGIKISGRETRDIVDIYAITREELGQLSFVDPGRFTVDIEQSSDEDLRIIARNWESTARFGWSPYMHNPSLASRLSRIDVPTLVLWGEANGLLTPAYGRAFAEKIPGAQFKLLPNAAHHPHLEQPEAFAEAVSAFAKQPNASSSTQEVRSEL